MALDLSVVLHLNCEKHTKIKTAVATTRLSRSNHREKSRREEGRKKEKKAVVA